MNYEDRTDLVDPADVISASVLKRLRTDAGNALRLVDEAAAEAGVMTPSASAAIAEEVSRQAAVAGAPRGTEEVALAAASAGYGFGRRLLGLPQQSESPEALTATVDRIYLYALDAYVSSAPGDLATHVTKTLRETVIGPLIGTEDAKDIFEEFANYCWAWGLGLAVVEADRS